MKGPLKHARFMIRGHEREKRLLLNPLHFLNRKLEKTEYLQVLLWHNAMCSGEHSKLVETKRENLEVLFYCGKET
jgi:hypothetical protein